MSEKKNSQVIGLGHPIYGTIDIFSKCLVYVESQLYHGQIIEPANKYNKNRIKLKTIQQKKENSLLGVGEAKASKGRVKRTKSGTRKMYGTQVEFGSIPTIW